MVKKADTISLKGKEYAQVAERTKLFWQDNPHGSIKSDYVFREDGKLIYTTGIIRNAQKPEEGSSNGHAMGEIKNDKDFEKYETISVGRALAKLGYLASGEIASLEEMEDFYKHQEEKKQLYVEEQVTMFDHAKTLEELKQLWSETNKAIPEVLAAKDKRKAELEAKK